MALDLAATTVVLDFDGAVAARTPWRPGGGRAGVLARWDAVGRDPARARALAADVVLDPGFGSLTTSLTDAGAEVLVVADGLGLEHALLAPHPVRILTNAVDPRTGDLTFPNADRCCPCTTCGTCKQAPLEDARRRGRSTVFVGGTVVDRKAALLADDLFAKGELADWCEEFDVPFRLFRTLDEVADGLLATGRR